MFVVPSFRVANTSPACRGGAEHREILPGTVAGFWLPMHLGVAHYEACDQLRLSNADLLAMGEGVGRQSQESALSLAVMSYNLCVLFQRHLIVFAGHARHPKVNSV